MGWVRRGGEGVGIGIRNSGRQSSAGVSQRGLKCVVARIGHILKRENSPQAGVRSPREGIDVRDVWIRAGCLQIHVGGVLRRHQRSILEKKRSIAVSRVTIERRRSNGAVRDGPPLVLAEWSLACRWQL